jgi:hypothetical protein
MHLCRAMEIHRIRANHVLSRNCKIFMRVTRTLTISAIAAFAGCAQFVHVTPGTSVELALARKPEVIKVAETAPLPRSGQLGTARCATAVPAQFMCRPWSQPSPRVTV